MIRTTIMVFYPFYLFLSVNMFETVSDDGGGCEGNAAIMLYSSLPLIISCNKKGINTLGGGVLR